MALTTPQELLPAGWQATDLWIAPLCTAIFATLTHAQPFYTSLHVMLARFLAPAGLAHVSFDGPRAKLLAVDDDTARAICVVILAGAFLTRTVKTFGPSSAPSPSGPPNSEKEKEEMRKRALATRVAGGSLRRRMDEHAELMTFHYSSQAGWRTQEESRVKTSACNIDIIVSVITIHASLVFVCFAFLDCMTRIVSNRCRCSIMPTHCSCFCLTFSSSASVRSPQNSLVTQMFC